MQIIRQGKGDTGDDTQSCPRITRAIATRNFGSHTQVFITQSVALASALTALFPTGRGQHYLTIGLPSPTGSTCTCTPTNQEAEKGTSNPQPKCGRLDCRNGKGLAKDMGGSIETKPLKTSRCHNPASQGTRYEERVPLPWTMWSCRTSKYPTWPTSS